MNDFDPDSLDLHQQSFINGAFESSDERTIKVLRPSDGKLIGTFADAGQVGVDRAVGAAQSALHESRWSRSAPRRRAEIIRRWADLVDLHRVELARIEAATSSRPISETLTRDIPAVAELLRFYAECADKTSGEVFETQGDVYSFTRDEPYGVVGAIAPWNVPLLLATLKIAPALAAGNAVVLKPSELTPFSALRLAELSIEAGLPAGLFSVLVGTGPTTGTALVRHPGVGCITFTGSTRTGIQVMSDAAAHGLKPVSLELGGKSPQVVFDDIDSIDQVATHIAHNLVRNSGQVCFSGTRLVVQRRVRDQLVEQVVAKLSAARMGPTWSSATTLPPIISCQQASRIKELLEGAGSQGAELRCGGRVIEKGGATYVEPTVLVGMSSDADVLLHEVFGPVLTVETFDDYDDGIKRAAHPLYGLAAGVYTKDINKALDAAANIDAGTIWINTYGRTELLNTPFGGFKQSGIGKDFGVAAYRKYRKSKSVVVQVSRPG